jgi:predicted NAD/FAD-binding protein
MNAPLRPQIAIVGSGIAGLTAAYRLAPVADVTVFEQNPWIGGHTHTVDVDIEGRQTAVDTGFIVFNEWTYPRFLNLLGELGLHPQHTDMSFSVTSETTGIEYAGNNLSTLFAQRRRLLSPAYYRFLLDIMKFNRLAIADLEHGRLNTTQTLGDYLQRHGLGALFRSHYLLPMAAAIWSSDLDEVDQMSVLFLIRFFKNHGLLSVTHRPQWFTLPGGSRSYIDPLTARFHDRIHLSTPVERVETHADGVTLSTSTEACQFDGVVMAAHSDQSLRLLASPTAAMRRVLSGIPYADNDVVLHTDRSQMPKSRRAWASWNYQIQAQKNGVGAVVTYDMNRLQNLTGPDQFFVTLNNTANIDPATIIGQWTYAHPQFGPDSLNVQSQIQDANQGQRVVVCGAWCRNGFHEDGVVSGENAAHAIARTLGLETVQ